ncbi:hypothetical protein [Fibrella forsythiae]|uniref:Uncharacterized protein n=1 Tax=Fibrella forsythiae TaxID=2817061 RepID=A0ABS3JTN2_9BACT|nr:hypothetical protein [Fibrella forsythiae]MBO0953374.1 hypothetical protein [Fibrella forsythiae]
MCATEVACLLLMQTDKPFPKKRLNQPDQDLLIVLLTVGQRTKRSAVADRGAKYPGWLLNLKADA